MHQRRLRNRLATATVGKALAARVGLSELVFFGPAAALDEVVDVRAVGTFGIAIHPKRCDFERAAMLLLIGQRMLANEVLLERLVCRGGHERGFGEQPDLQRHEIAEDPRDRDHDIDPRPAQCRQGHERCARDASIAVEARHRAHQRKGLSQRPALGLQVVTAPQDQCNRLRKALAGLQVAIDQSLSLTRTVAHRKCARDTEGIETMQVAAGRQHIRGAKDVAARRGPDEATIECPQDALDLMVFGQQAVSLLELCKEGLRFRLIPQA